MRVLDLSGNVAVVIASILLTCAAPAAAEVSGSAEPSAVERIARFYESLGAAPVPCGDGLEALGVAEEALCASVDLPFKKLRKHTAETFDAIFKNRTPFLDAWDRRGATRSRVILLEDDLWTVSYDREAGILAALPFRPCPRDGIPARTNEFVPPRLVERIDPDYPAEARRERLNGIVVLEVRIDVNGVPDRTCVVGAYPEGSGFEEAAVAAVRRWRYEPARSGEEPVPSHMISWIEWTLHE